MIKSAVSIMVRSRIIMTTNAVQRSHIIKPSFPPANLFSTVPQVEDIQSKSSVGTETTETEGTVGKRYRELEIRCKGYNEKLPIEDLRQLLMHCKEPSHAKYIKLGLTLYQNKGQDFNEEFASQFVRASIRCDAVVMAAEICGKYENRIGSWLAPKNLQSLTEELLAKGELQLLVTMLDTISKKGVIASLNSLDITIGKLVSDPTNAEQSKIVLNAAKKLLNETDYQTLIGKYSNNS